MCLYVFDAITLLTFTSLQLLLGVTTAAFTPIKSTTFTGLFESVRSMIKVPDAGPHFSKLNSDYINPETNPTFTDAISTVVELEEGDMLWM